MTIFLILPKPRWARQKNSALWGYEGFHRMRTHVVVFAIAPSRFLSYIGDN